MSVAYDPRSTWQKWLHRVGYVATALILAELILIAAVAGKAGLDSRQIRANMVEKSRTHDGALLPTGDSWVQSRAVELLRQLTPIKALHGEAIRFIAMPSFGSAEYGVVLWLPQSDPSQASGIFTTFAKQNNRAAVTHRDFIMPATAYRSLMSQIDKLTDDWPGDADDACLDGSPAAFERVRGKRVTSGIGNCNDHYERLKTLMLAAVRRYAPGDDLPTENDWHRFEPGEQ